MTESKNMVYYVIKRLLLLFPMLIITLIATWILTRSLITDPVLIRMAGTFDLTLVEAERQRIGWYEPWYVQLGIYLSNFFTGNLGTSYTVQPGIPVINIIANIVPRTVELIIIPVVFVPIIAVKLGVIAANNVNKRKDHVIRGIATLGAGVPVFWIGVLLQIYFGMTIRYFTYGQFQIPIVGSNSADYMGYYPAPEGSFKTGFRIIDSILYNDQAYLWDTLIHLILPVICMTIVSLAGITRQMRSSMIDVLEQDYIRTARAKGCLEKEILNKHALRNSMIPTSNYIVGGVAQALVGSIFIEITFNYTGFGYWMLQAIFRADIVVINGLLVFSTIVILSGILVADVLYTIIDPRITYK